MCRLAVTAKQHRIVHGGWPNLAELRAIDRSLPARDRWQGEFAFEVVGDSLTVSCSGPDRVPVNDDDVICPPVTPDS